MKQGRRGFLGTLFGGAVAAKVAPTVPAGPFVPAGTAIKVSIAPLDPNIIYSPFGQPIGPVGPAIELVKTFNAQTYIQDKLDMQNSPLLAMLDTPEKDS